MANQRLEQLQTVFQENPNDPFLLFALAQEYGKMEEDQKSLEHYHLLTERHPGYVGTAPHLVTRLEQHDQPAKALSTYRKVMEVAKSAGDQHAYSELAGA
ncbi:MAG: tetratricopeptide repeat protein, partial [Bacteroidota bacterium]